MVLLSKTSPARRTQLGQSGWWMATSRVSRGKLLVSMKKGEPVPDDWALAIDGSRTTDAAQAFHPAHDFYCFIKRCISHPASKQAS